MIKEIKFTDKALKQITNLLSKKDKGSFFRIAIKGCLLYTSPSPPRPY